MHMLLLHGVTQSGSPQSNENFSEQISTKYQALSVSKRGLTH